MAMSKYLNQFQEKYGGGALSLFLFLCTLTLGITKVYEPDTLWHIKLGEDILRTQSLPVTVPFAYTGQGVPWLATEWLSEVLFYLFHSLGGLSALTILNAFVLGLSSLLLYNCLLYTSDAADE